MEPIPFIRVSGDHTEAGRQIGAACREQLARSLEEARSAPPDGLTWDDMRQAAAPYLAATRAHLPWIIAEFEGAAAGSGIDLIDLVAFSTEEIWRHPPGSERCSDFAVGCRSLPMAGSGWPTTMICRPAQPISSWPSNGACPASRRCSRSAWPASLSAPGSTALASASPATN